jgi:16S rRNA (uracil1498-N3)-methyltransferase
MDWSGVLGLFKGFDLVLMAYERQAPGLREWVPEILGSRRILVLVGPEGGFDQEEVRQAGEAGARMVHLPMPVLRTETAGVAVASILRFLTEAGDRQAPGSAS